MSARASSGFSVLVDPSRTLLLRGELDQSTVPELERKIAKVMEPLASSVGLRFASTTADDGTTTLRFSR